MGHCYGPEMEEQQQQQEREDPAANEATYSKLEKQQKVGMHQTRGQLSTLSC